MTQAEDIDPTREHRPVIDGVPYHLGSQGTQMWLHETGHGSMTPIATITQNGDSWVATSVNGDGRWTASTLRDVVVMAARG